MNETVSLHLKAAQFLMNFEDADEDTRITLCKDYIGKTVSEEKETD